MDMAEAEQPDRLARRATIGDIRQLAAGSTPHSHSNCVPGSPG
jgi:hypothetical protein